MGLEDLQEFSALYSGNSLGYFSAELLCIDNVIIDNYHSWIEIAFDAITTFNFSNGILFVTGDICPSFLTINEELNSNLKLLWDTENRINKLCRIRIKNKRSGFVQLYAKLLTLVKNNRNSLIAVIEDMLRQHRLRAMSSDNNKLLKSIRKVHNFVDRDFATDIMTLLDKGPKFIPCGKINVSKFKAQFKSDILKTMSSELGVGSSCNFTEMNDAAMGGSSVDDIFTDSLYNLSDTLENFKINNKLCNVSQKVLDKTIHLSNLDDVILNTADKNLGLCINSTRWYNNEYIRQLSNTKVYQLVTTDVNSCINTALLDLKLLSYKHEHYLGSKTVSFLNSRRFEDVKIPSLNLSPKIHQLNDPPSHINESLLKLESLSISANVTKFSSF